MHTLFFFVILLKNIHRIIENGERNIIVKSLHSSIQSESEIKTYYIKSQVNDISELFRGYTNLRLIQSENVVTRHAYA